MKHVGSKSTRIASSKEKQQQDGQAASPQVQPAQPESAEAWKPGGEKKLSNSFKSDTHSSLQK